MSITKFFYALFGQDYKETQEERFSERFLKLKESLENDLEWRFSYSRWTHSYYASRGGIFGEGDRVQLEAGKIFQCAEYEWMNYKENKELYKILKKGFEDKLPFQIKMKEEYQMKKEKEQLQFIDKL